MRMNLLWIAALASTAGVAFPQEPRPRHAQSPVGPVGHWKGDDGFADASGNGFAGTAAAGAAISPEAAPLKFPNTGSFSFDGKTGMVTVPDAPALRLNGDLTVSFWRRKTAHHADWIRLVGKGGGGPRTFGLWDFPGDGGQVKFQIYNQNGGSILELDSPGMPSIHVWHHFLVTVSVNAAAMYVDGKLTGNALRNGDPAVSADPVTFGHAGYHSFYAGQLDDIRLYDRSLSMSEVVYLAAGNGPPAPPADLRSTDGGIAWMPSSTVPPAGTATYYTVKRSKTAGSGYAPVAAMLTSTSWADPAPEAGAAWHYVVTALNTGGESAPSNELKPPSAK